MAQDLPFSVANILRSDFPPPSRISKIPKLLRIAPLSEYTKIPVSIPYHLDRGISRGFFTYGSPMLLSCSEEDVFHSPAHKKDQQVKPSTETPREDGETGSKRLKNRGESKSKGAVKKKRNRSHFTQLQLKYLEDVFSRQQYLTRDERALLANGLEMTELQIRNWFQNRRYQLRHRGMNRPRQVPVKVLVSSNSAQAPED
ncbi:PREDICTED: homeobox protein HMX2-like [Acropora digitifera]|uniref:homeobox protein HMX2-like n=1 Tax=Acropora digitifera TaxID=70779 RepID=UPI00077A4AF9|nr:PREDICTED: homeobox protein HMX2-like [Acropora digitifera]XP_029214174.1 homeobox protein HMX2-like [Acropora millepora]